MDTGTMIQKKSDDQRRSEKDIERENNGRALELLEKDLSESIKLCEAMDELNHNFAWISFQNILIQPARARVREQIEQLNEKLGKASIPKGEKGHLEMNDTEKQQAIQQIIYNNAFLETLQVMCDFEHLIKMNRAEQAKLKIRIKDLEKRSK
jgi:hypothetical protein